MSPDVAAERIKSTDADGPDRASAARRAETHPSARPLHADVAIAAVIIGGAALIWAGTATFEEVPAALAQGMGPAVFPRLIAGVIALLALWLALSARGRPDPGREPVHRSVWLTGFAVLAFMGVLKALGMYAAILFAAIGIGRLWGERRWWLLAAVGVGMAVAIHLFFVTAFGIPLPRGIAGAWLS